MNGFDWVMFFGMLLGWLAVGTLAVNRCLNPWMSPRAPHRIVRRIVLLGGPVSWAVLTVLFAYIKILDTWLEE